MTILKLNNKILEFFRLNLISLKLNYQYKYYIYILLLLFISVISSIIIRTNVINDDLLNINNNIILGNKDIL